MQELLRIEPKDVVNYYKDELTDYEIYMELAKIEKNPSMRDILMRLASYEEKHSRFWRKVAEELGIDVSKVGPSRISILTTKLLRRILGLAFIVKLRESEEMKVIRRYYELVKSGALGPMTRDLENILLDEVVHEDFFSMEGSRFEAFINNVRDAIYGMSDGLVEVLAAVAGLAPIVTNPLVITLAGIIVGASGTLSMAIGAYMSVKAQRDIREARISKMEIEVNTISTEERETRARRALEKLGISDHEVPRRAAKDPSLLRRLLEVSELGYSEKALEDPARSALYTGIFYLLGSILVVAPFPLLGYLIGNINALLISVALVALVQGMSGVITAISGSGRIARNAALMIGLSLGAAGATYSIGSLAKALFGVSLG